MMASHGGPAPQASLLRRAPRRGNTMTQRPLLLVEDDAAIAAVLVETFADEGYAVQTAGSPQEARRLLVASRPHDYALVLSDSFIQSPADPFTWLDEVRARTTAPVVIFSAHVASVFRGWQDRGFAGLLP